VGRAGRWGGERGEWGEGVAALYVNVCVCVRVCVCFGCSCMRFSLQGVGAAFIYTVEISNNSVPTPS